MDITLYWLSEVTMIGVVLLGKLHIIILHGTHAVIVFCWFE